MQSAASGAALIDTDVHVHLLEKTEKRRATQSQILSITEVENDTFSLQMYNTDTIKYD